MNLNAIHNTYIQENYSGEPKCKVNTSVCVSIYIHMNTPGSEYTNKPACLCQANGGTF